MRPHKDNRKDKLEKKGNLAARLILGGKTGVNKIRDFLEEAAVPIISGIIGSFIGMGIAALLGIL